MFKPDWIQKRLTDGIRSLLVFGALLGLSEFLINAEAASRALMSLLVVAPVLLCAVLIVRWFMKTIKGEPLGKHRPDAATVVFGACAFLTNLMAISRPETYFLTCAVFVVLAIASYIVRRTNGRTTGLSLA